MSTLVHWNCYAVLITTLCAKSAASWFRSACKGVVNSPRHRGCHKYVKTQSFHMDYFHVRCGLNFGLRWLGHMIPRYIWHIESIYTWMLYSWRADSIYIYNQLRYLRMSVFPIMQLNSNAPPLRICPHFVLICFLPIWPLLWKPLYTSMQPVSAFFQAVFAY